MYTNVISVVTQQIPPLCTDEVFKLHRITFKDFRLLFRSDEIVVKSSILYLLTEVVRLSAVRLSARQLSAGTFTIKLSDDTHYARPIIRTDFRLPVDR